MSFKGLLGHPGFADFEDLPELGARDGIENVPRAKSAADEAFAGENLSTQTSEEPTDGANQTAPAEPARGNKKPMPFSLRLSFDERARLEVEAGDRPLGAYIRERLFGDEATKRVPRRKPTVDRAALGKALATLGQSNLASNLNQLARAANIGTLPVDDEVVQDLNAACAAVCWRSSAATIKQRRQREQAAFGAAFPVYGIASGANTHGSPNRMQERLPLPKVPIRRRGRASLSASWHSAGISNEGPLRGWRS